MSEEPGDNLSEPSSSRGANAQKRPAKDDIGAVTSRFIQEIDSLTDTLPLAMRAIGQARKGANEDLTNFIQQHGRNLDEQRGTAQIAADDALQFQKMSRRLGRVTAANDLVPRGFFVTLVSQYDAFLGRLIEALLLIKPEVLNASEKTLSFSDLVSFGSIEAARDHIIEKEVESVLRKSHPEQFDWLEGKFGIKLRHELTVWPRFVEVTERRNLFVHTGGQVSSQYLQSCRAHKVDCGKAQRGQILSVSPRYYHEAYEVILEIGVKLAHVFWRKLQPEDLVAADNHLNSVTYNLLVERKYDLAKSLLDFALDVLKKHASSNQRLRFVVNRAQAYKWSGEAEQAVEILDREDFSALSDPFKLANAVLRDDFPRAIEFVRRIGREGGIGLGDYREWPLFRELRKQDSFDEAIVSVFGEPLHRIALQAAGAAAGDEANPVAAQSSD